MPDSTPPRPPSSKAALLGPGALMSTLPILGFAFKRCDEVFFPSPELAKGLRTPPAAGRVSPPGSASSKLTCTLIYAIPAHRGARRDLADRLSRAGRSSRTCAFGDAVLYPHHLGA